MNWKTFTLVGVLTVATGICFAELRTDYDHSVNFTNYHTYSWMNVHARNSLWSDRIKRDVSSALASKGWVEVPSGGEASVSAFGTTREQPTLDTFYDGFGGGWGWRGFGGLGLGEATTTTEETPIGTLVVDIFDSHSKKLIFRGMDTRTLTGNPEKNADKLAKSVDDMFKKFPPPEKD